MIELRWRKCKPGWTDVDAVLSPLFNEPVVLQYREGDWTTSSNPEDPAIEWSNWKDVKIKKK